MFLDMNKLYMFTDFDSLGKVFSEQCFCYMLYYTAGEHDEDIVGGRVKKRRR